MDGVGFDEYVLINMPTFIAINYERLLKAQKPQEQVELILHIYNLGLRVLTVNLVSQYVFRDRDRVSDSYLDKLLEEKFPHLTPDAWEEMLFTALRSYEGNQDLLFMPELYDFYWDTSTNPHRRRDEVKAPFDRLTQVTIEVLQRQLVPQDEVGWLVLAKELRGHLQHILERLSFIGKYDLIHVISQDENSYTYELYKGTHISIDHRTSFQSTKLIPGWFYLRTATEDFLRLDPWFVFWDESLEGNELLPTDIGVFDRLVYVRLRYLLTTPGQTRMDDKRVNEFTHQILDAIEEHRSKRQEAEKLTWVQLCDIGEEISKRRMATVRGKYHKGLYLQRDKVHRQFEAFLAEPHKRGFVLVGKSGVGKSNFLLALAEELQSRSNVCMLMYDGANLPVTSSSLTEIISRDFSERVFLSRQPVQQVWHQIARIDGIDERQIVFCVDAINENPQAKELLRQLDELVQGPWPWLKVVLSSRPETWQSIKRGVKLAEALYYQRPGAEIMGVELEPFSYSQQMEPFSRQELPEVYNKYQREFHLQTPYEALTHEVREILRDPLNLWLLASTHRGQAIPANVKTLTLIEHYVQTRLQREDLRFLENRLVPLMVRENHYSNVITEEDLNAAGDALYEIVYSDQVLSDGRRMNQPFLNLSDADILVQKKQGFEDQIVFKFERFYEYFAGRRIVSLSEKQTDRYAFFLSLIGETTRTPFLWGAVRNALIREAQQPNPQTILQLCRTTKQRVKDMMVSVFITVGMDNPESVERILEHLMSKESKSTEWRKGRQLLGRSTASDLASRNAARIAIEVASNLQLTWVLKRAALQEDPTLRTEAVRYGYHLWQRNQARGFEILDYLAVQAVHGLLPNMAALESALGLSVIMFFGHYQDRNVLQRLQNIWHEILAKLLRIRDRSDRREGFMRAFIREQILSLVSTVSFWMLDNLPKYNVITYKGLEKFFQLGPAEKSLYRNLVQYLNIQGNYAREQMENDFLQVTKINNLLLRLVAVMGLVAHACHSPRVFLPFLKKLFEETERNVAALPYMTEVMKALECVLDRDPMIDEVFDFFVYAIEICQQSYTRYPQALSNRFSTAPEASYLGPYILYHYQRTGTVRTERLETWIQNALSKGHIPFFDLLLTTELPHVGIELQKPLIALDALRLFFKSDNAEIDRMIQFFLARLRVRYPDEVDDFLEEQQAPDDFRLQVQTNEPVETIGELIGQNAWYFLRDEILLKSPALRSQVIQVFDKAADCKNLRTWLNYFIRQIINVIYGGEALRQTAQ